MTEDKFAELAIGGLAAFGSIIAWQIKSERRTSKIEFRVETIWDLVMKRAMTQAVEKGLGIMKSPMTITEEGRVTLAAVLPDLLKWYEGKQTLSNRDLAQILTKDWMDRIGKEVKLPVDEAIALAFSVLRPPPSAVGTAKAADTDPELPPVKGP